LAVAVVVVVAVEVEVEEEEEESRQDPPHSQESWEAIHQKSSMEIGRKAKPSYSISSSIEE